MEFKVATNKSINDAMRTIGYQPAYHALSESFDSTQDESKGFQNDSEFSMVRKLGKNEYPRFHLYIKEGSPSTGSGQMQGKSLSFSLHLDQKKPSYEGSTGHSGEYDGKIVESEAERIKDLLRLEIP